MLVLQLKKDKVVHIGDATLTILKTTAGGVKVGIEAPPEIPIQRDRFKEQSK